MKRASIKRISKKKQRELYHERLLELELLNNCGFICEYCLRANVMLKKHEIIFRSKGGSPVDKSNCIMLCIVCHQKAHRRGGYISAEELQEVVKRRCI